MDRWNELLIGWCGWVYQAKDGKMHCVIAYLLFRFDMFNDNGHPIHTRHITPPSLGQYLFRGSGYVRMLRRRIS